MTDTVFDALSAARGALATRADLDRKIAEFRTDFHRALWMQAGIIVAAVVALVKLLP